MQTPSEASMSVWAKPSSLFNLLRVKLAGEVGTAVWTFGLTAVLKLGSSMLLTRMLYPEAYGVVTMVASVLFTIEMLSDLGFQVLIVRQPEGEQPRFLNTVWTIKLIRSVINASILWFAAPYLARFFNAENHVNELRVGCVYILFTGIESFGFLLAIRHQKSRINSLVELAATFISTLFALGWSYHDRSPWGMILAMVLQRALMASASYFVVSYHRKPVLMLDRPSLRAMGRVSKAIVPSSLMTLALSQTDKILLARLLPLQAVGLYGIGQNMAMMVEGVSYRLSGSVLFPRFTSMMRDGSRPVASQCYHLIHRPVLLMLLLPVLLGMHADLLIRVLYDSRYAGASTVLEALCVRSYLISYNLWGAQLLLAAGYDRVQGIPPALRAITLPILAYAGFSTWGFNGILLAVALEPLSAWMYVKALQRQANLLHLPGEYRFVGFTLLAIAACALSQFTLMGLIFGH